LRFEREDAQSEPEPSPKSSNNKENNKKDEEIGPMNEENGSTEKWKK
jgi:hypothetical protein